MAQKIGGTAYFKVDGSLLPLRGNFTVSSAAVERAGIAGQDYVHGFTEVPRIPSIEGDVSITEEVSVETIQGMTNVTVTAELLNGRTYVLREAWWVGPGDIQTREGMARIKFEGISCDEIV